jgi:hypothetical protein
VLGAKIEERLRVDFHLSHLFARAVSALHAKTEPATPRALCVQVLSFTGPTITKQVGQIQGYASE